MPVPKTLIENFFIIFLLFDIRTIPTIDDKNRKDEFNLPWHGNNVTMEKMIDDDKNVLMGRFLELGGKIDKYYLRKDRMSKQVLVNLNGWFTGKNVQDAITKAIAGQNVVVKGSAGNT